MRELLQISFRKNILPLILAVSGLFFSTGVFATHIIGGEISYRCLGNNNYRIILDVYRDCYFGQAPFDQPARISVFNDANEFVTTLSLPILESDTVPNNIIGAPCLFPPSDICVEWAHYEGTFTLNQPGGFHFVYQRCCRNGTIQNIVNPIETGATYAVYLSAKARQLCNSSPRFGFTPPVFVCVNKPLSHPHAGTDIDGDSLVYKFYTPNTGATISVPQPLTASKPPYTPVSWISPPFGLNNLLGSGTPLAINSKTGRITGLPTAQGQFVVGVQVEEYRKGELLSVVSRDLQYNIGICEEIIPIIFVPKAQCDNQTVVFKNQTPLAKTFKWYFNWPDTTWSSSLKEPTVIYPDTGKYVISLVAEPGNQCQSIGFDTILLQKNSLKADLSVESFDCSNMSVIVVKDLSKDFVSPPAFWNWVLIFGNTTLTSNLKDPVFEVPNPSSGTLTLTVRSVNGCEQVLTKTFSTGGNNPVNLLPKQIDVCHGKAVQLNPNAITTGFTYKWDAPVPVSQQGLPNPTVTPLQTTNYLVTITGYNGLCESVSVVRVNVISTPNLNFAEVPGCDARTVQFNNTSQNEPFGYFWNFGDPNSTTDTTSQTSPSYTYPSYGPYRVVLMTSANSICKDTLFKDINLTEKILQAKFGYEYTNCSEDAITIAFKDESINNQFNTKNWLWQFSGAYEGTSSQKNPSVTVTKSGQLQVKLTVTTLQDCISSAVPASLNIDITKLPGLQSSEVLGCISGGVILNPGGNPNYRYKWSPAVGLTCNGCNDPSTAPSPLANPSLPTVYTVQIMNINADTCFLTRTVKVDVPLSPGLVASDDIFTCLPEAILNATTFLQPVTIGWFVNNLQIGGGNTIKVGVSGIKTITARATDQFGCHYYEPVIVSGGPVDIEVSGQQLICSNEPLNVSAQSLDPNDIIKWQWSPIAGINGPSNIPNPNVIRTPGEKMFYVEARNQFGCTKTDSVFVAIVDENINLDFDFQVECSGSVVKFNNLSNNAYGYLWDFGDPNTLNDKSTATNPSYTYPMNGVYKVMLTIGLDVSCRDTVYKEVTITDPEFTPDFDFEYITCDADSVEIQFYDSSINFLNNTNSWKWSTSTGLSSTISNPIFKVYAGQEFTVSLTIGTPNGCTGNITETMKLNFIKINLPDTLVLCLGDSISLNPTGDRNYSYLWSGGNISNPNAANPKVSPKQTTTYFVNITSFSPDTCMITKSVTVFVPPKIEVTASKDTLTCGQQIQLFGFSNISPTTFSWTSNPGGPVGNGASVIVLPSVDTWFRLVGTDKYGCKSESFVFVANESVKVNLDVPNQKCPDLEIVLKAINNVPGHVLNYAWSSIPSNIITPPLTTQTVNAKTPVAGQTASYSLVVSNQYGCSASVSRSITSFLFKPTVISEIAACPGVGKSINPGADPSMKYFWSPTTGLSSSIVPNPTVTLDASANYTVNVSKDFGEGACQQAFNVAVTLPPIIGIKETVDTFTCGIPIVISALSNVTTTMQWLDSQGSILGTGSSLSVNPKTIESYFVKATDNSNCSAVDTVIVSNNQIDIVAQGDGIIDICPKPSYDICITNLDPKDILNYQWTASNGGQILKGADTACPSVTSIQGQTVVFRAIVSNQWGCKDVKTINLKTYSFDPVIRGTVTICPGVKTPINPGGNLNLSYSWSPKVGLSCYDCPNPEATLNSSQQYIATVLGFNGADTCSLIQTVQVRVNEPIKLKTLPVDTVICKATDLLLSASTSSSIVKTFVWATNPDFLNPIANTPQVLVRPSASQTYFVMATDTLGCKETANIIVQSTPVDVSLTKLYDFCVENAPLLIPLKNNSPSQKLTYQWSPTTFIQEVLANGSIVINIPQSTTFYLNVTNQFGCKYSDSTHVTFYNIGPTIGKIKSSKDTIIFNSGQFSQLEVEFDPTYTYQWIPQSGLSNPSIHNPKASPDQTTTYKLIVTNKGNCRLEREVTIVVINPECTEANIFIPNAFTPNGDGKNDVLFVRSNIIDQIEFEVFNRWGQKVFETSDKSVGWNGTFKGQLLTPDVYGYYVKATCFNGEQFFKKGNVMLLR